MEKAEMKMHAQSIKEAVNAIGMNIENNEVEYNEHEIRSLLDHISKTCEKFLSS